MTSTVTADACHMYKSRSSDVARPQWYGHTLWDATVTVCDMSQAEPEGVHVTDAAVSHDRHLTNTDSAMDSHGLRCISKVAVLSGRGYCKHEPYCIVRIACTTYLLV